MKSPVLFALLFVLAGCSSPESKPESVSSRDSAVAPEQISTELPQADSTLSLTVSVYENTNASGWGFDILKDGKPMIHQPHIPAVSGTKGFASRAEAEAAGRLMLDKISKGVMPPTVSVEELDSMGIRY
jgi:hypothetical protein